MANPTVTLRTRGTQLAYPSGDRTLLEVLEQHDIPMEYQCRSGYCGACRTRLLNGKVAYCHQPLACLQDNEILPCCCIPLMDIELAL